MLKLKNVSWIGKSTIQGTLEDNSTRIVSLSVFSPVYVAGEIKTFTVKDTDGKCFNIEIDQAKRLWSEAVSRIRRK